MSYVFQEWPKWITPHGQAPRIVHTADEEEAAHAAAKPSRPALVKTLEPEAPAAPEAPETPAAQDENSLVKLTMRRPGRPAKFRE